MVKIGKVHRRHGKIPSQPHRKFLIVVEGLTEKNYFETFKSRNSPLSITVYDPDSTDALGLMKECKRKAKALGLDKYDGDRASVVFDTDAVDKETMEKVMELSAKDNISVIVSNSCFEHWLILHFRDFGKALDEDEMKHELSRSIGMKYEKGDPKIFQHFTNEHKLNAIKRARKQLNDHDDPKSCYNTCPSSNVFKLLEDIMD